MKVVAGIAVVFTLVYTAALVRFSFFVQPAYQ